MHTALNKASFAYNYELTVYSEACFISLKTQVLKLKAKTEIYD